MEEEEEELAMDLGQSKGSPSFLPPLTSRGRGGSRQQAEVMGGVRAEGEMQVGGEGQDGKGVVVADALVSQSREGDCEEEGVWRRSAGYCADARGQGGWEAGDHVRVAGKGQACWAFSAALSLGESRDQAGEGGMAVQVGVLVRKPLRPVVPALAGSDLGQDLIRGGAGGCVRHTGEGEGWSRARVKPMGVTFLHR